MAKKKEADKEAEEKAEQEGGEKAKEKAEESEDFQYIVRVANTDLDGAKTVPIALSNVKGIGTRVATIITDKLGVDRRARIGDLEEGQIEKIEEIIGSLEEQVPPWLLNRRREMYSGKNMHIYSNRLPMRIREDVNFLKKIRCYRGIKHERGHKVRGQRTRSNGRTGLTMGVQKRRQKVV